MVCFCSLYSLFANPPVPVLVGCKTGSTHVSDYGRTFTQKNSGISYHKLPESRDLVPDFHSVHPPKQTWNLKMDPWKRRFLLETIISRFQPLILGGVSSTKFHDSRHLFRVTFFDRMIHGITCCDETFRL